MWYQGDEEDEEDLMCSPAILARRASESWINVPPAEVNTCHALELIIIIIHAVMSVIILEHAV